MSIDKSSFDLFSKKPTESKSPEFTIQKVYEVQPQRSIESAIETPAKNVYEEKASVPKLKTKNTYKRIEIKTNKYESFLPVTLRLKEENFMDLKHIENSIMRSRSKAGKEDRERITSNSILRCLVTSFIDRIDLLDFEEIDNEEILNQRMQKLFKAIPATSNQ
jgi:hypothetical protein